MVEMEVKGSGEDGRDGGERERAVEMEVKGRGQ